MPGRPAARAWRRWASTSSPPGRCTSCSARTPPSRDSDHDFGKNIIPGMIEHAPGLRLPLPRQEPQGRALLARRRHARRLLPGQHGPDRGRSGAEPVRPRLADPHASSRSCRRRSSSSATRGRPARPAAARPTTAWSARAASSRGGHVRRSILSPNVRVNSYALVENSILFDGVDVGRHCRIRRAIIDKDVKIPPHTTIGYDLEHDRQRGFTVTEQGVVVIAKGSSRKCSRSRSADANEPQLDLVLRRPGRPRGGGGVDQLGVQLAAAIDDGPVEENEDLWDKAGPADYDLTIDKTIQSASSGQPIQDRIEVKVRKKKVVDGDDQRPAVGETALGRIRHARLVRVRRAVSDDRQGPGSPANVSRRRVRSATRASCCTTLAQSPRPASGRS